jgi:hypothetical protein
MIIFEAIKKLVSIEPKEESNILFVELNNILQIRDVQQDVVRIRFIRGFEYSIHIDNTKKNPKDQIEASDIAAMLFKHTHVQPQVIIPCIRITRMINRVRLKAQGRPRLKAI